jgi:hypothetical protein
MASWHELMDFVMKDCEFRMLLGTSNVVEARVAANSYDVTEQ